MDKEIIEYQQFEAVDIRVGEIVAIDAYPEARNPSFVLKISFGESIGVKKSIAQLPANYTEQELVGRRVICVMNFKPRQIGSKMSEVLTLGLPDVNGDAVLVTPDKDIPLGGALF